MAKPRRSTTRTKTTRERIGELEEIADVGEVSETVETTTAVEPDVSETKETPKSDDAVDQEAVIAELRKEILSKEDQAAKIKELQRQLAEAERRMPSAAVGGNNEFKLRPDIDEGVDFYYFEIMWHPKRSEAEEEQVALGVNGKMMMWPRNVPTVIRSDYLEVADNAFSPKFTQLPGEDRKQIGGLKPFTYTINRKITEEEYIKRKAEGNKALQEHLQRQGM